MSNCSAEDVGLVIMAAAVLRATAALVASAHFFFQAWASDMLGCHDADECCSFWWLPYRADVTNSSKHRSALELRASYVVAVRKAGQRAGVLGLGLWI